MEICWTYTWLRWRPAHTWSVDGSKRVGFFFACTCVSEFNFHESDRLIATAMAWAWMWWQAICNLLIHSSANPSLSWPPAPRATLTVGLLVRRLCAGWSQMGTDFPTLFHFRSAYEPRFPELNEWFGSLAIDDDLAPTWLNLKTERKFWMLTMLE